MNSDQSITQFVLPISAIFNVQFLILPRGILLATFSWKQKKTRTLFTMRFCRTVNKKNRRSSLVSQLSHIKDFTVEWHRTMLFWLWWYMWLILVGFGSFVIYDGITSSTLMVLCCRIMNSLLVQTTKPDNFSNSACNRSIHIPTASDDKELQCFAIEA